MPRGVYGKDRDRYRMTTGYGAPHVGAAGSVFGHTPGDVADELDQLNNEILAFSAELVAYAEHVNERAPGSELARLIDEQRRAAKIADQWVPLRARVEKIQREMEASPNSNALLMQLRDAQLAFESHFPREQRVEFVRQMQARAEKIWALRDKETVARDPQLAAFMATWGEFAWNWTRFHSHKTTVPLQTLPLSGTWDRVQEYRQQFVDLYNKAPFTPTITPLDPKDRKDPDISGGVGDVLKSMGMLVKVVIYGGLGLVGIVAASSIVQQLRKDRDPLETYAAMAREGATTAAAARGGGKR